MTRIAIISDPHGNLSALQAAVADARALGVDELWCGGDLAGKGPRGRAVVEFVRREFDVCVRGNWEEFMTASDTLFPSLTWYRAELGPDALEWLATLPFHYDRELGARLLRLFHASPTSVHTRVHWGADHDVFTGMFAPSEAIANDRAADLVVYGDLHDQFLDVRDGRWLVNAGSAGNALDGDTRAAYVIVEDDGTFDVRFRRVAYDVQAEISIARATELPFREEWIEELTDGRHRPRA